MVRSGAEPQSSIRVRCWHLSRAIRFYRRISVRALKRAALAVAITLAILSSVAVVPSTTASAATSTVGPAAHPGTSTGRPAPPVPDDPGFCGVRHDGPTFVGGGRYQYTVYLPRAWRYAVDIHFNWCVSVSAYWYGYYYDTAADTSWYIVNC